MKVVVAYKWAPNPQDAVVAQDGTVDWTRTKRSISEYDPVAIELARRLADAAGGQTVGVTAGSADAGSAIARKAVLSRGLDSLVVVADDALRDAGSTQLASVLAAIVRQIGDVDLVITGDASVDVGARMVPTLLAGWLGWPVLAEVTAVSGDAGTYQVERSTAEGTQTLEVRGPAVLSAASDAATPRVPGMKDILAAGNKPVEVLELGALDAAWAAVAITVLSSHQPEHTERRGQMIEGADPATAAAELIEALCTSGAL